jgi:NTP pyrophosphatase (non-canonical NTP hydrolase)
MTDNANDGTYLTVDYTTNTSTRLTPSVQDMVLAFHKKFARPAPDKFRKPSRATMFARLNWIWDETDELNTAINEEDYLEIVDALADIIYYCYGFAVELGVELDPVIAEVQKTNMLKEGGPTRLDGKILKPEGWCPPDIAGVLSKQGIVQSDYGLKRDRTPTAAGKSSACGKSGCGCDAH